MMINWGIKEVRFFKKSLGHVQFSDIDSSLSCVSKLFTNQKLLIMKKFMVIYHAPAEAMAQMASATPEQKEEGMKPWFAWKETLGEKLLDLGSPLMPGVQLLPDGTSKPSTKEVTGYSMIQAVDAEEAKSLLKGHPHLSWTGGCDIELHELVPM